MGINTVLEAINDTLSGEAFLVGGSVRDLLLGYEPRDMDLVVHGSAQSLAHKLAEVIRIRPVVLNKEHDIVRAVFPGSYVDITGLVIDTLKGDLKRRDFTINAMALPLNAYLQGAWAGNVIDPLNGLNDLRRGVIRACSPHALEDDPLRILRALRLKARLDFSISPDTVQLMHNLQRPLSTVPGERVWEELRRILEMPGSTEVFRFLYYKIKVLQHIFPEAAPMESMKQNYYHADNVWEHCFKTLIEFEHALEDNNRLGKIKKSVQDYLQQPLTRERKRLPVIKLACLFHDVGKLKTRGEREDGRITFYNHHKAGSPMTEEIGHRLRMSKKELRLFQMLVEGHMQPLFLYKAAPPSDKAVLRFFRGMGEETPGCLLLSLADVTSSRNAIGRHDLAEAYSEYIMGLLKRYEKEKEWLRNTSSLLSGKEICDLLNLTPCPLVGEVKEKLRKAQMEGKVDTRQKAVEYIKEVYKQK